MGEVDESAKALLAELQRGREALVDQQHLRRGNGGGTSDGMEPRIAKLEAQMEAVRSDLSRLASIPVDLATVKENVRHLPSKGFVVTTTSTTIAVIGAIVIFADKLRALVAG